MNEQRKETFDEKWGKKEIEKKEKKNKRMEGKWKVAVGKSEEEDKSGLEWSEGNSWEIIKLRGDKKS